MDKGSSSKVYTQLDQRIDNLVKTKEDIEKRETQVKDFNPVTKEDLEKLNFDFFRKTEDCRSNRLDRFFEFFCRSFCKIFGTLGVKVGK